MAAKRALQPLLVGLGLFAVYVAFLQQVLYGDGVHFLIQLRIPYLVGHNWLYLPVLAPVVRALSSLGLAEHTAGAVLSAACAAGGGAFLLALLRSMSGDSTVAILTTLLVALSPSMLFFATTLENHAHHFLWVTACLWMTHRAGTSRSPALFAVAGVALAGAYASHQTAVLLIPAILLLAFVWTGWRSDRRIVALGLSFLLAPPVVAKLIDRRIKVEWLGGGDGWRHDEGLIVLERVLFLGEPPAAWLPYWQSEFLGAAFGLVIAALAASIVVLWRSRALALAVLAGVVPYLLFFARWGVRERGAYYTAVWPLLALPIAAAMPPAGPRRRGLILVLAMLAGIQFLAGIYQLRSFAREDPHPAYVAGLSEAVPAGGFLLTADSFRTQHARYWRRLESEDITKLVIDTRIAEASHPGALARFPAAAADTLSQMVAEGRAVVIEDEAWDYIRRELPDLASMVQTRFRREPATPRERPGVFRGFRLLPR